MAWRPIRFLVGGVLDNTEPGKVTGWMYYRGLGQRPVLLDLDGDFHRDIRGAKIRFKGEASETINPDEERAFMKGFSRRQTGVVGDITAGLPPRDYVAHPYIEWYSVQNGRVVLEPNLEHLKIIGTPIPFVESEPISRSQQDYNMARFLDQLPKELRHQVEDKRVSHWSLDGKPGSPSHNGQNKQPK